MQTEALKQAGTPAYDRIRATAKATKRFPVDFALKLFILERFLVRLQSGPAANRLVLKGGMLLLTVPSDMVRMTDDVDMSSHRRFGLDEVKDILRHAAALEPEQADGVTYTLDEAACCVMGPDEAHSSVRSFLNARLHTRYAPINVRIKLDISALDGPHMILSTVTLPIICKGFDPPTLPAYAWEQVLADKIHACHRHGATNKRLRDYYDIINLGRSGILDAERAAAALAETMHVHEGQSPDINIPALSMDYANANQITWAQMIRSKNMKGVSEDFGVVMEEVRGIVDPIISAAAQLSADGPSFGF